MQDQLGQDNFSVEDTVEIFQRSSEIQILSLNSSGIQNRLQHNYWAIK